jgi:hypothetical protein
MTSSLALRASVFVLSDAMDQSGRELTLRVFRGGPAFLMQRPSGEVSRRWRPQVHRAVTVESSSESCEIKEHVRDAVILSEAMLSS